jgi:hypothetical protein
MGRAVQATVGDGRVPFIELGLEVHQIDKRPPRQEVPLHILDARFDLAFGLRPIRAAHAGLDAPIVGKGFERGIPEASPRLIRITDRPRPVIQMLPGVPPEVRKGPFVRLQELRQALVRTGVIEPAAAEPHGEHEHMHDEGAGPEGDSRLPPINLTLLARGRLKPEERPIRLPWDLAQRRNEPRDGFVTARVAAVPSQLLIQNPRRVIDLGGTVTHKIGMGGQERRRHRRSVVRFPPRLPQTAAHRLAIHVQSPPDLRNGHPLLVK